MTSDGLSFDEFTKVEPRAAATFVKVCFADDARLVELGILSAPRASLHAPNLWSYDHVGSIWRASGSWDEIWEWCGDEWHCAQERPLRSPR